MERTQRSSSSLSVLVRPHNAVTPMTLTDRLQMQLRNTITKKTKMKSDDSNNHDDEDLEANGSTRSIQYRLDNAHRGDPSTGVFIKRLLTCGFAQRVRNGWSRHGMSPNQNLAMYLHWMFRVNFLFLFAVMWLSFIGLTIVFAGLITIAGQVDPGCVQISGNDFASAGTPFSDAFALSWTTFTTVGYGSTSTGLSHTNTNFFKCFWVDFICSVEALFGIIYSSFCGAILFGKILRIQSTAQVMFSDPLLIRFGAGLSSEYEASAGVSSYDDKSLCPVLEFRIVNKLYGDIGGEIMDATLNVVASVGKDHLKPVSSPSHHSSNTTTDNYASSHGHGISDENNMDSSTPKAYFSEFGEGFPDTDEDPTITDKHVFQKMRIEPSDHPFFKRVWLVRHVLDHESPILKHRVRRLILRNGGYWPQKFNNYEAIRDSLQFNQILVSFNGISNVSSIDVYAQRIYDFYDLNIGYQFVNILYREEGGAVGVDIDLINDVREQNGGGGEPLLD